MPSDHGLYTYNGTVSELGGSEQNIAFRKVLAFSSEMVGNWGHLLRTVYYKSPIFKGN